MRNWVHKQVRCGAEQKLWQETDFTPRLQLLIWQTVENIITENIYQVYGSFSE